MSSLPTIFNRGLRLGSFSFASLLTRKRLISTVLSSSVTRPSFTAPSNPQTTHTTHADVARHIHTKSLVSAVAPTPTSTSSSSLLSSFAPTYLSYLESDSIPPYTRDETQSTSRHPGPTRRVGLSWFTQTSCQPFRTIAVEQTDEQKLSGEMTIWCRYGMTSVGWSTTQTEFDSIISKGIDYDSASHLLAMRILRAQIAFMLADSHQSVVFERIGYCQSEFLNWANDVSRMRIDQINEKSSEAELYLYMQVRMQEIIREFYEDVEPIIREKATGDSPKKEETTFQFR